VETLNRLVPQHFQPLPFRNGDESAEQLVVPEEETYQTSALCASCRKALRKSRVMFSCRQWFWCAQQTGMHILVMEALLTIYLFYLGSELILIGIRKSLRSSTCLIRCSWTLSSCAFPAGSCRAEVYEYTSVRTCE